MKILGATIFIFLLTTQILSKWLIVADYTLHKQIIAEKLCENRSRPELKCEGKCQLAKKMASEENQNNESGNSTLKASFSEIIVDHSFLVAQLPVLLANANCNSFFVASIPTNFSSSIFHPPLV